MHPNMYRIKSVQNKIWAQLKNKDKNIEVENKI